MTRSSLPLNTFDWKKNCFLCGAECHPKKRASWSMVQSAIGKKSDKTDMYTMVLRAAEQRKDTEMLTRLHGVPNGDLVAIEARYHRLKSCYLKYIKVQKLDVKQPEDSKHAVKVAVGKLISELQTPIIDGNQVFLLTSLKKRFIELLKEEGVEGANEYRSERLKKQLSNEWQDISFVSQPGMSDFVCSNKVSVGEALKKAQELVMLLKEEETGSVGDTLEDLTEDSIIHQAVGILRRRIEAIKDIKGEYHSPEETTMEELKKWTDPLLYKTVCWLTNKQLFDEAADVSGDDPILPCLSIACDIITQAVPIASPKHLSLAVHLHHEYGSKKLIEVMHSHGYCISYTQLRQFLTSAAEHVDARQEPTVTRSYIPPEITPKNKGGQLIVAAADNWDHNERTVDGKRTTHAMTTIFVQRKTEQSMSCPRIRKTPDQRRSIDLSSIQSGDLSKLLSYREPKTRPGPQF